MKTWRRVRVAFVDMGGAVATAAITGTEMIKSGSNRLDGLPPTGMAVPRQADCRDFVFGA